MQDIFIFTPDMSSVVWMEELIYKSQEGGFSLHGFDYTRGKIWDSSNHFRNYIVKMKNTAAQVLKTAKRAKMAAARNEDMLPDKS